MNHFCRITRPQGSGEALRFAFAFDHGTSVHRHQSASNVHGTSVRPTFVITHGMGGTEAGDRFHQLAEAICRAIPESNVLMIDWSKQSWRTRGYFQIPSPWDVAWSFQTYSLCDCQSPIADVGFFLETPTNAMAKDQHVFGVAWLTTRLQSGDLIWLFPELILPEPKTEDFDAIVTISGEVLDLGLPRHPFITETDSEPSEPIVVSLH